MPNAFFGVCPMRNTGPWTVVLLLAAVPAAAADTPYSIKEANNPPPKELNAAIGNVLNDKSVQLLDAKGNLLSEYWFRKEVPVKATPEQIKNGLTYQEVAPTTLLGVVQVVQQTTDYRKQKIKPGLYTLRLGIQPMNGDHMGTAPYPEFCLLVPASEEKGPEPLAAQKDLEELSTKASGSGHPAIFLLFPPGKAAAAPQLVSKDN